MVHGAIVSHRPPVSNRNSHLWNSHLFPEKTDIISESSNSHFISETQSSYLWKTVLYISDSHLPILDKNIQNKYSIAAYTSVG